MGHSNKKAVLLISAVVTFSLTLAKELELAGVKLLNGPMDRPWGIRTVSFQDPSGHTWEIANHRVSN